MPKRFLFGLKAQLVERKVGSKRYFYMDVESNWLWAGGKEIVSVSVSTDSLKVGWLSPEWTACTDLQQSAELKQLISTSNEKLTQSRSEKGKGKGEGKDSQ